MAETPAGPADAGNGETDPSEDAPAPQLGIVSQYIKDLSFENPLGAGSANALQQQPQVSVEVSTGARSLAEGRYEVTLVIRGEAKAAGTSVFIAELTYGGVITLENIPPEAIDPVLYIEGPRMLFPFARNIIADVTRDGGFPPLFINPIDFVALYRERHMSQGEGDAGDGADGGDA